MQTDNNNTQITATTGEWYTKYPFKFSFGNHLIETDQQVICRLMENDYDNTLQAQANAELICKAVNNYSKLVEENERLKKSVEYIRRNAEKINEHTWKTYKEQILIHA